jgi:uncharacterized protein (TIGR03790 family)
MSGMKATTLTATLAIIGILLLLPSPSRAGLGPQNVILVVNAASPASLAIGNEYIDARHLSPANVVYVELAQAELQIIQAHDFRKKILQPVFEQIRLRGLAPQIDCVTYSGDFPHVVGVHGDVGERKVPKVISLAASINSMTYLYRQVLQADINYLSLTANHYAPDITPKPGAPSTQPIRMVPPRGFHRSTGWNADGSPLPNHPEQGYLLSTVLGVTSGRGNTVDEIKQMIRRSAAADCTAPKGTIYYLLNQDIRSKTRKWGFGPAIEELKRLGVAGEIVDGVLPRNKNNVAGTMVGISDFEWNKYGSTILPGAICEHLTSNGGVMFANGGQTCISEFIRAGASGTSGTVMEPFAIQEKFPSPFIHVYYAAGCSLAEAFYQSVSGPYQLLIIGDPLCKPWGKSAELTLDIEPGAVLKGHLAVKPACKTLGFPLARFELYVDGVRRATTDPDKQWGLDTTQLADGYHELRVVAIASDAVESQCHLIVPVTIDNHGERVTVTFTPPKPDPLEVAPLHIQASMKGAKRLILMHNNREVATAEGESAMLSPKLVDIGAGPIQMQVIGVITGADGVERRMASEPIRLTLPPTP